MATINSRNESNKFIKQIGSDFVHKFSGESEDITVQILDANTDKSFNVFSNEECSNLVGDFSVFFRQNDGVYLKLSNLNDSVLLGDVNSESNIEVSSNTEEKLLEWNELNPSTIINITLKSL